MRICRDMQGYAGVCKDMQGCDCKLYVSPVPLLYFIKPTYHLVLRVNLCGKVKLVCFDKTGTLTEDCMNMYGVMEAINQM